MSEKEQVGESGIKRRKFLRATGASATAASIGGLGSTAAVADESAEIEKIDDVSRREINSVLTAEPVRTLVDELKRPQLGDADEYVPGESVSRFKPSERNAERTIGRNGEGEVVFDVVRIPVGIGTLGYADTGDTEHAYLKFDTEAAYPGVVHDVESASDGTLVADGTNPVFNTAVQGDELKEIADLVDADVDAVEAVESTDFDGYLVTVTDGDQSESSTSVYTVNANRNSVEPVDESDSDGVEAQIIFGPCATLGTQCIGYVGICGACAGVAGCPANPTGCAACIVSVCGGTAGVCGIFAAECM